MRRQRIFILAILAVALSVATGATTSVYGGELIDRIRNIGHWLPVGRATADNSQPAVLSGAATISESEVYPDVFEVGDEPVLEACPSGSCGTCGGACGSCGHDCNRGVFYLAVDRLERHWRKWLRGWYYFNQRHHKHLIHEVQPVTTHPTFGYYQTCWRRFPPVPDRCPPACDGAAIIEPGETVLPDFPAEPPMPALPPEPNGRGEDAPRSSPTPQSP